MPEQKILVIKLSALGDFILSFQAFAAIRAYHPNAKITLLTTEPYVTLAEKSLWFDKVLIDTRPSLREISKILTLRKKIRGFDQVYDLQTSDRSAFYYRLAGKPVWCGTVKGAKFRHTSPSRHRLHSLTRLQEQLKVAGITAFPIPDLNFLRTDLTPLFKKNPVLPSILDNKFALLVPGASPKHPSKRWPAVSYGKLGNFLLTKGIRPLIIGSETEYELAQEILQVCPQAFDLTGETSLLDLFSLAEKAVLAVGNDTGPMHLITIAGPPCLVLFSQQTKPSLSVPCHANGKPSFVVQHEPLTALSAEQVAKVVLSLLE